MPRQLRYIPWPDDRELARYIARGTRVATVDPDGTVTIEIPDGSPTDGLPETADEYMARRGFKRVP